jgi:short-subunit dehydrogenase
MNREYALITGSSKGLGRLLANEFASNGYGVILHGRNNEKLEETKEEVESYGNGVSYVLGDLKDTNTLDMLVNEAREKDLSVLVNNAADSRVGITFEDLESEDIENMVYTNLIAPMILTKEIYNLFLEREGNGSVININSVFSLETKDRSVPYSTSKWGLRGFSDTLRAEGEKQGIRVMDVYPTKIQLDGGEYGMDGKEAAQSIYKSFKDQSIDGIFLDGRPDQFKPDTEENGLKMGITPVEVIKKC